MVILNIRDGENIKKNFVILFYFFLLIWSGVLIQKYEVWNVNINILKIIIIIIDFYYLP